MSTRGFEGAICDVDGVLVDSPHERAWKDSLRELMENDWADIADQTSWSDERFTPQVYQRACRRPRPVAWRRWVWPEPTTRSSWRPRTPILSSRRWMRSTSRPWASTSCGGGRREQLGQVGVGLRLRQVASGVDDRGVGPGLRAVVTLDDDRGVDVRPGGC